jgi:ubiquinone/menaquinone biosynthesis C-methylase UbiE
MLTEKFWEKYFRVYDSVNSFIPYQKLLDRVCDELKIQKGEKVLEAGCGTCNLVLKIKEKGGKVVGLDNCRAALNICAQKDSTIELILANLEENLPFSNNFFDKITCNNTLYTISQKKQLATLKELHRVLRIGGMIVLSNPKRGWNPLKMYVAGIRDNLNEKGFLSTIQKITKMIMPTLRIFYYNLLIKKESNYHFFESKEQRGLLKKAGFSRVSGTIPVYANQGILNSAAK